MEGFRRNRIPSARAGPFFYLIEEAVSNSFRHGLASQVTIELSVDPEPKLTVLDDGIGPVSGPAGLGSKVLDSAAISWTLSPGAQGGSELTVFLK
jgi:two-component sensor histidine kinase